MAVEYGFKVNGKDISLNKADQLLCDYQGIEYSNSKYCNAYLLLLDLTIPMVTHNISVIDKNFNFDVEWIRSALQGDIGEVKAIIEDLDLEIYAWRD